MAKYELKTKRNNSSVKDFIDSVENDIRRKDSKEVLKIMKEVTSEKPVMWGSSIIGFGTYHYKYKSGQEGDWPIVGFSPRKQNLTIYIMTGYDDLESLTKKLGPHKLGKSCLYIKNLDDVDISVLKKIIEKGYKEMKKIYK